MPYGYINCYKNSAFYDKIANNLLKLIRIVANYTKRIYTV